MGQVREWKREQVMGGDGRQEMAGPETVAVTGVWEMILREDTQQADIEAMVSVAFWLCVEFHMGCFSGEKVHGFYQILKRLVTQTSIGKSESVTRKWTVWSFGSQIARGKEHDL